MTVIVLWLDRTNAHRPSFLAAPRPPPWSRCVPHLLYAVKAGKRGHGTGTGVELACCHCQPQLSSRGYGGTARTGSSEHSRSRASGLEPRESWPRVKAVFLEALDVPADQRREFLANACAGDSDLRREVESLLDSDEHAGSFCEAPAAGLLRFGAVSPSLDSSPVRLPAGARLGHYEVTGFIAAGGMGEVYRARDTQLGRDVAIKRVGAEFADPRAAKRLIREAQHASSLTHPNICTIYEVGNDDGVPFIVMELIEGRPLAAVLREGRPALATALRYAIDVADALDHAHGRRVVHRDLKSANIVIDSGGKAVGT